ncbi:hypothetical protein [Algisphaera agarilytica]|uniref:CHAD domain-containing protein n=1 Tax=Algisphaera agarilytica TaxID=1385975 RepID=A0A7X0H8X3_9BACT|nr:hypothetical protein [Algisphaera agarilytica]MBB6429969.1 hypothetical protein [Algisphaera agarilytica]
MPPLLIKRTDPIVKAVRRGATRQLDAAIESLTGNGSADPAAARRELQRLQALLHQFRRPLGGEVFNREHRQVVRCLKQLSPVADLRLDTLADVANQDPKLDVQALREQLIADTAEAKPRKRKKQGPDPKQLRLVADLAELRMRARYWHLPDGGFELLTPGLRLSYQRAAKLVQTNGPAADTADALDRLALQLQSFERACPVLLEPYRKALRALERNARKQAQLAALRPATEQHEALLARIDETLAQYGQDTARLRQQLFVETTPAFLKRMQGYWTAWRG